MTLRVAVAYSKAPFAFYNNLRNGSAAYAGFLVDVLSILLTSSGFNSTDVTYYSPSLTGELTIGRADIVLSQITALSSRIGIVDQSFAVLDASQALLTKTTTLRAESVFTFLKPFTWHLWLALLCTVFAISIAQLFVSRLSPLGTFDLRSIRRMDVDPDGLYKDPRLKKYAVQDGAKGFLLDAWMTATGQTPLPVGKSWSIRIVQIAYGLFSAVVFASYTAALAAYLTLQVNRYTVLNLEGLAASGGKFAVDADEAVGGYFVHPNQDLTAQLAPRAVQVQQSQDAIDGIRNGSFAGYIGQYTALRALASLQPCDMAIVDRGWGYSSQVLLLQLNSTLTPVLNMAIVQNRELGTVDQLLRGWETDGCSGANSLQSQQLKLASFSGLWYMLLMIWVAAIFITFLERFFLWLGRRFPNLRQCYRKLHVLLGGDTSKHYDFGESVFEGEYADYCQDLLPWLQN